MGFSNNGSSGSISGSSDVALNNVNADSVLLYDADIAKWRNSIQPMASASRTGSSAVGQDELVINIQDHGARGNGDDITNLMTALIPTISKKLLFTSTYAIPALYFPTGRYRIDANVLAFTDRVKIFGDGPGNSMLELRNGSVSGDIISLGGAFSSVSDMFISGRSSSQTNAQDGIAINTSYALIQNIYFDDINGDGISVGKTATSILSRISECLMRDCTGYGIQFNNSTSTDNMIYNTDIGRSGKSGVWLNASGQNLVNVHVWGNGIISTTNGEMDGITISNNSQQLSNVQSETNNGKGINILGGNNHLITAKIWNNRSNGIHAVNSTNAMIDAVVYNAGLFNISGTNSAAAAAICLDNCTGCSVRLVARDTGQIIGPASYTTTPPNPFIGRASAVQTQSYGIVELNGSDSNHYSGVCRAINQRVGALSLLGTSNIVSVVAN